MKRILITALGISGCFSAFSQHDSLHRSGAINTVTIQNSEPDSTLLYRRFPFVPSFKLTNIADSSIFTKDDLKKKKATIIMVFSPDCENCQEETRELTANIHLFKKAQIIMVSPLEYRILRKFYDEYRIADYPTITMGRDPSYYLGTFYRVRSFPAIFVYNKKGDLVRTFQGGTPVEIIADAIR